MLSAHLGGWGGGLCLNLPGAAWTHVHTEQAWPQAQPRKGMVPCVTHACGCRERTLFCGRCARSAFPFLVLSCHEPLLS